jgi:hypothetical protein
MAIKPSSFSVAHPGIWLREEIVEASKVGDGERASAYAFKSKQACEAAQRKHDADWARMIRQLKKQIGNRGTFAAAPRTRCMDSLPLGFERPKTGS